MWGIIAIVLWAVTIIGFVIWNLLNKNQKLEELIVKQNYALQNISDIISSSKKTIDEMEVAGAFKADDEIGYFFKALQSIQVELNQYIRDEKK